jgi:hypothetical protein
LDFQREAGVRHTFLMQMRDTPDWSVLIQTAHWFHSCDAVMGTAPACILSKELQTLAAAARDDDFSGSSLIVCENGNRTGAANEYDEEGWIAFSEFFHEKGIYLPFAFIGTSGGRPTLYVPAPKQVERADYVVLKVPRGLESNGPYLIDKLGMMAEAISLASEGEEGFTEHMRDRVWRQAQAILATGDY